jgi:hypothetical protein
LDTMRPCLHMPFVAIWPRANFKNLESRFLLEEARSYGNGQLFTRQCMGLPSLHKYNIHTYYWMLTENWSIADDLWCRRNHSNFFWPGLSSVNIVLSHLKYAISPIVILFKKGLYLYRDWGNVSTYFCWREGKVGYGQPMNSMRIMGLRSLNS